MPAPLFRALAIQRYVSRGFGPKSTLTAPSRNRLILVSATFLAAVTLGMLWRPLPERIAIYGQLKHPQPFLQRATGQGLVDTVTVLPNDQITQGDVIAYLRPTALNPEQLHTRSEITRQLEGLALERALAKQQYQLDLSQIVDRQQIALQHQHMLADLTHLAEQRFNQLNQHLSALSPLIKQQFISIQDWQHQQRAVSQAKAKILRLRLEQLQLDQQLKKLKAEQPIISLRYRQLELDLNLRHQKIQADLKQLDRPQREPLHASLSGKVLSVIAGPGDYVDQSSPMIKIAQTGAFQANLIIPAPAAGFLNTDDDILLQVATHASSEFGLVKAKIKALYPIAEQLPDQSGQFLSSMQAIVSLTHPLQTTTGRAIPFRPGSKVKAWITTTRASTLERLYDQVAPFGHD